MKNTLLSLSLLATLFSTGAMARDTMTCVFTEPFISYEINQNGRVYYSDSSNAPKKDISDKVSFAGPYLNDQNLFTYQLLKLKEGELADDLELSVNMDGNDGMSDLVSVYSAKIKNYFGAGKNLYGACHTTKAPRVVEPGLDDNYRAFFEDVQHDVKACYTRALSDWTHGKSNYKNVSVFSVLYSFDGQAYAANKAIDTLSSAESEELVALVNATKPVPQDNESKNDLIQNAIKVCDYYTGRLLDRFSTHE